MKILCIHYSVIIPLLCIVRICPDKDKLLAAYITVTKEGYDKLQSTFYDASKTYTVDRVSEDRYELYLTGVMEMQFALEA